MTLRFERIAVLGATGATGRTVAAQLAAQGTPVRVISRRLNALQTLFPDAGIEKRAGDALDLASTLAAIDGCDLVIDCVGLPSDAMADHPRVARTLAAAIGQTGARCVQVSSYWSFIPIRHLPVSETSPRSGGPPWVCYRREAEDILRAAGAAVAHFPDFFGPHLSFSTLQLPLKDAVAGKPMNWIGAADIRRDYIFVPDAMRIAVSLAEHAEAYGKHWVIPGSGPISAREVAALVGEILGHDVKVRTAGPLPLRVLSWFNKDLRGFLQMVPTYVQPISYDGARITALLGNAERTPYASALRRSLTAISQSFAVTPE